MRTLAILTMVLVIGTGCKKSKSAQPDSDPPKHVSSGGGLTAPNQNGNLTVTGGRSAIQRLEWRQPDW